MSPLELDILLHYHTRGNEYADGDADVMTSQSVRQAIDRFMNVDGMLQYRVRKHLGCGATYELTERAKVYVEHILSQPLPIATWKMPPQEAKT